MRNALVAMLLFDPFVPHKWGRMWLAVRVLRRQPVIANVDVAITSDLKGVVVYGSKLSAGGNGPQTISGCTFYGERIL